MQWISFKPKLSKNSLFPPIQDRDIWQHVMETIMHQVAHTVDQDQSNFYQSTKKLQKCLPVLRTELLTASGKLTEGDRKKWAKSSICVRKVSRSPATFRVKTGPNCTKKAKSRGITSNNLSSMTTDTKDLKYLWWFHSNFCEIKTSHHDPDKIKIVGIKLTPSPMAAIGEGVS